MMLEPRESKLFIKSRFARRGIYWLPNLFTIMALCAGFYAIVQAMRLPLPELDTFRDNSEASPKRRTRNSSRSEARLGARK